MRRSAWLVVSGLILALPPAACCGEIERHEENQEERIERGRESGSLTDKEADRLERREEAIDEERWKAKHDGGMTQSERERIRGEQEKLSEDIYHQKHDDQHR